MRLLLQVLSAVGAGGREVGGVAAIGLGIIALLIMFNFDVMIESDGFSPLVIVIPAFIAGSGVVGVLWGSTCGRAGPRSTPQ